MPTMNPRVNVTLSPSLDALVSALAAHQRASKSQVLRELLEAAEPALRRAVALMDAASKASAEVRLNLARSFDNAQDQAEKTAAELLAKLDQGTRDLVTIAEEVRARRPARRLAPAPAGSRRPSDPPPSKRGVKSPRRGQS